MQPEYELIDGDTAEAVMRAKEEILILTDGILGQSGGDLLSLMREHRAAVGMAEELMLAHEGENPADELLYGYAEGLMLWHLLELAWLTETELRP